MARMELTFTFKGDKKVLAKLKRTQAGLKDMKGPMRTVSKFLTHYYSQAFVSQGGVFGMPWPRLNRYYEVEKHKRYPGRPPLIATGRMQRGFKYQVFRNGTVIHNPTPYFKYHQSSAPRSRLPRRLMMAINSEVEFRVFSIINQYVRDQLRKA